MVLLIFNAWLKLFPILIELKKDLGLFLLKKYSSLSNEIYNNRICILK